MLAAVIALLAGTMVQAGAPAAAPGFWSFGGKSYTLVSGDDLGKILPGNVVFDPDCRSTAGCVERFASDGHGFKRSGDRVAWTDGSYAVLKDQYCITLGKQTQCNALLRADDGRYLELRFQGKWVALAVVKIEPDNLS